MKIVNAPHPSLRKKAKPITTVDKKVISFTKQLTSTLKNKKNPRGVGLAAPQVDTNWRAFVMDLANDSSKPQDLHLFVNPRIVKTSSKQTYGPHKQPTLEGCLSIPGLYGPIPRHQWIEVEYDQIVDSKLTPTKKTFEWFAARVIQHEIDHLEGVLFTDYSLEYDLPLYRENTQSNRLEEIEDYSVIEVF